jgi:hypothetical protein
MGIMGNGGFCFPKLGYSWWQTQPTWEFRLGMAQNEKK